MTSNTQFLHQLLSATVRDTPAFGGPGRNRQSEIDALRTDRDDLYAALARLVDVSEAASSWPEYQSALADARTVLARTSGGAA